MYIKVVYNIDYLFLNYYIIFSSFFISKGYQPVRKNKGSSWYSKTGQYGSEDYVRAQRNPRYIPSLTSPKPHRLSTLTQP